MPILDAICDYLETGTSLVEGTTLFKATMPPTPDACVAIYEYPGRPGVYTYGSGGAKVEMPRIQILSRALTYAAARSTLETIYTFLDGKTAVTLGGTLYLGIFATTAPAAANDDRDDSNREYCSCNFEIQKVVG